LRWTLRDPTLSTILLILPLWICAGPLQIARIVGEEWGVTFPFGTFVRGEWVVTADAVFFLAFALTLTTLAPCLAVAAAAPLLAARRARGGRRWVADVCTVGAL
jgi:hypothetical protein